MEQKNSTEVLIDGTVYKLSGTEDEMYLRKVAAYLNDKIGNIRQMTGFGRMSAEYQALMIELNVTDDYFKVQSLADELTEQKALMEKDAYSLKHELITTQMKLESVLKDLEAEKVRVKELEQQIEGMKAEREQRKAFQAAAYAAANGQQRR